MILLRNEVLALVNLGAALQDGAAPKRAARSAAGRAIPVVVVDFEGRKIGLEVERIHGTREVVIKSLSRHYREVEGLIGASILGNGKIALIVDVETMIGLHYHHGNGKSRPCGRRTFDFVEASEPRAAMPAAAPAPKPSSWSRSSCPSGLLRSADADAAAAPVPRRRNPAPSGIEDLPAWWRAPGAGCWRRCTTPGAIQASISLSQLTGQEIRVSFPESRLVPLKDVAELMGGEESHRGRHLRRGAAATSPAGCSWSSRRRTCWPRRHAPRQAAGHRHGALRGGPLGPFRDGKHPGLLLHQRHGGRGRTWR